VAGRSWPSGLRKTPFEETRPVVGNVDRQRAAGSTSSRRALAGRGQGPAAPARRRQSPRLPGRPGIRPQGPSAPSSTGNASPAAFCSGGRNRAWVVQPSRAARPRVADGSRTHKRYEVESVGPGKPGWRLNLPDVQVDARRPLRRRQPSAGGDVITLPPELGKPFGHDRRGCSSGRRGQTSNGNRRGAARRP